MYVLAKNNKVYQQRTSEIKTQIKQNSNQTLEKTPKTQQKLPRNSASMVSLLIISILWETKNFIFFICSPGQVLQHWEKMSFQENSNS